MKIKQKMVQKMFGDFILIYIQEKTKKMIYFLEVYIYL
jgi:hypothetical protein